MSKKPSYFDRMFIANPCPTDWNKMSGNDQMRYCSECNKQVYNLSKMSRDKAEALVARFEGRLCARFERGADGMILTEETVFRHSANQPPRVTCRKRRRHCDIEPERERRRRDFFATGQDGSNSCICQRKTTAIVRRFGNAFRKCA